MADNNYEDLFNSDVVDVNGDKIGSIGQVYLDDQTGQPSWVTVKTGWFGLKETFVPLEQAVVADGKIAVPYTTEKVKDAPRVDPDKHLDADEEAQLYDYYGIATVLVDEDEAAEEAVAEVAAAEVAEEAVAEVAAAEVAVDAPADTAVEVADVEVAEVATEAPAETEVAEVAVGDAAASDSGEVAVEVATPAEVAAEDATPAPAEVPAPDAAEQPAGSVEEGDEATAVIVEQAAADGDKTDLYNEVK